MDFCSAILIVIALLVSLFVFFHYCVDQTRQAGSYFDALVAGEMKLRCLPGRQTTAQLASYKPARALKRFKDGRRVTRRIQRTDKDIGM